MSYKKVGVIESISEIPFNKNIIVTGSVGCNDWKWRMEGEFKHKGKGIVFRDVHGCVSHVGETISLNILEKVTA